MSQNDLGGFSMQAAGETQSSAVAAQAAATIQARYLIALKRPRDMDQARVSLMKECARLSFARVARFCKPVGKGRMVTGPSIRFAEAAIRCLGNVQTDVATIYDDASKRIVRVTMTDLEANTPYSRDVTIEKTVERTSLNEGQSR